jgi:hypothetical protein
MIKLTDARTGQPMYLDETKLLSVSRVKPFLLGDNYHPECTRITLLGDPACFHVTETPDSVMVAIPLPKPESKVNQ